MAINLTGGTELWTCRDATLLACTDVGPLQSSASQLSITMTSALTPNPIEASLLIFVFGHVVYGHYC